MYQKIFTFLGSTLGAIIGIVWIFKNSTGGGRPMDLGTSGTVLIIFFIFGAVGAGVGGAIDDWWEKKGGEKSTTTPKKSGLE